MTVIGLDMETRSKIELKKCGADVYASDESTDIICCSFINKTTGRKWLWYATEPVPEILKMELEAADEIEAHNARFDQLIYEYIAVDDYGFPPLKKEKWVCTIAQARVNALPAGLDAATRAANAQHKKDHTGSALIQKLCVPNKKTGEFNFDPKLIKQMGRYCMKDSEAMVALTGTMRPLSDADKLDWQINERINDRGIMIDRELATLAQGYAEREKEELGEKLSELTEGAITKVTQTAKLLKVLRIEFDDERRLLNCMKKPFVEGEEQKWTLDKAARGQLLELEELPDYWREVITLIDQGGNSSVSKFTSMLLRADSKTDRVHGAFIFAGAGQTQRYCVTGDTTIQVLSPLGEEKTVAITELDPCDLVWDGEEYVTHQGVTLAGYKEVIEYDGITATPDHKIITERGDTRTISEAQQRGDKIKVAGIPSAERVNLSGCAPDCLECKHQSNTCTDAEILNRKKGAHKK